MPSEESREKLLPFVETAIELALQGEDKTTMAKNATGYILIAIEEEIKICSRCGGDAYTIPIGYANDEQCDCGGKGWVTK